MHFEDKSLKDERPYVFHDASGKVTAKTDKICRNESKICMTSQIYGFFNDYFQIFKFLLIIQAPKYAIFKCGYSKQSQ